MVTELVGEARRRFLCNEMLAQGAWALSAAMAAVIVLLLLGTQILDWQWLLLLPLATCVVGTWRTWRRLPSRYAVAQLIDRRLGLADTLSTAYFFIEGPAGGSGSSSQVRDWQREQAERMSAGIRANQAVPFTMPRAIYTLAILGVAASSLFALRYGLDRRLDLQRPLARILQQAFGLEQQQLAALDRKKPPERKRPNLKDMEGLSLNEGQLPNNGELQTAAEAMNSTSPAESAETRKAASQSGKEAAGTEEAGDEGEASDEETGKSAEGKDPGTQGRQNTNGQEQAGKSSPQGNEGGNSSLMAKFREAMQNLLSRMKQPPTTGSGGQKQASNGKNSRQGKAQDSRGQSGQQGQQQAGGEPSEGQEGQGAQSQTAENAAGRGTGQNGEENASKQPGSGIGRQDGSKDVKLAEQLAAMGKISEIIGKRSANVSGEVTVEVQNNSNQQLATPYSNRSATHAETNAEISRDEVPVSLQAYVQQYFEQVRRLTPETGSRDRADTGKRP